MDLYQKNTVSSFRGFPSLGIVGAGQLCKMLALSCHKLSITCRVLGHIDDPAAQVIPSNCFFNLSDHDSIKKFYLESDIITIENENIDYSCFDKIICENDSSMINSNNIAPNKNKFYPHLDLLRSLSNKAIQKQILNEHLLSNPKFVIIPKNIKNTRELVNFIDTKMNFPCVIKLCRGGYDGKGTLFLENKKP